MLLVFADLLSNHSLLRAASSIPPRPVEPLDSTAVGIVNQVQPDSRCDIMTRLITTTFHQYI